jgi:hypothetical protein
VLEGGLPCPRFGDGPPPELFREAAELIPNARLILYDNRAHGGIFADRRFGKYVVAFLKAEHPAPR